MAVTCIPVMYVTSYSIQRLPWRHINQHIVMSNHFIVMRGKSLSVPRIICRNINMSRVWSVDIVMCVISRSLLSVVCRYISTSIAERDHVIVIYVVSHAK